MLTRDCESEIIAHGGTGDETFVLTFRFDFPTIVRTGKKRHCYNLETQKHDGTLLTDGLCIRASKGKLD